jgi:hypothetical protein
MEFAMEFPLIGGGGCQPSRPVDFILIDVPYFDQDLEFTREAPRGRQPWKCIIARI